jgi:hypothetical protein
MILCTAVDSGENALGKLDSVENEGILLKAVEFWDVSVGVSTGGDAPRINFRIKPGSYCAGEVPGLIPQALSFPSSRG